MESPPGTDPDAVADPPPGSLGLDGFGRVVVDGLRLRASPSLSGEILRYLEAGMALHIVGGPVRRDGFTWYEVAGPLHRSVDEDSLAPAGWVAAYGRGWTHLVPRRPVDGPSTAPG